ncbi:unnamed protein product [Cylicocyclus nassatus]|uniref:Uncharacterized protein n=1 Tax=Cylicocyclus nassatus TaxID=53992 RepID=A0AA36HFT3_CYLNA|nr:unnamed protein product [Cylicocyclus nassatus]
MYFSLRVNLTLEQGGDSTLSQKCAGSLRTVGSQYSSVSEMEEILRLRATIESQANQIRVLEGTVRALEEELSTRAEREAGMETMLKRTLQKEYETALEHEGIVEEYEARLKAREDIIVSLRKESEWMVDDLRRARCFLPLKRVNPLENVFRQSQEDELLLAYLSRSMVEKSTIEIQRDGRAFLTLLMVDNTTISGLMERNDGTPYNWEEINDDNVWRGDRPGLKLQFGHITIINLGGFMYMPPRMAALLKRSVENISGIYLVVAISMVH